MVAGDLDQTDRVTRLAFGTYRGLPDPATAFGDAEIVRTRFRAAPDHAWVTAVDGEIVGAGSGPTVVIAVGAREHQDGPGWGGYTVEEVALRHEASVEQETSNADEAYAAVRQKYGARERSRYHEGWLPD